MNTIFAHDPVLAALEHKVVTTFGPLQELRPAQPELYFERLIESIVSQQLSVKVADVIFARLRAAIVEFTPDAFERASVEELRALGLSNAKASYTKNLAAAWKQELRTYDSWSSTDPEEIIRKLVQVKGIGRWTAEMFLLFTMAHPDIFSIGDYGLRTAVIRAYALDQKVTPNDILLIAQNWAPHRSYASRLLWKSLEL